MRLLALLLVLLSAGGTALAQRSDVILTKNQVRAMAPEAVARRLFGGLAPLVLPIADRGQPGVRPTRPLRSLSFLTRPSSANWDGICRTEAILVEFEPAGPPAGADTRVRPRRFTSGPVYFVPDPARLRPPPPDEESEDPVAADSRWNARADAACAGIDPRRVQRIGATEEYRLTALRLLLDLVEDARAGRAAIPLDCGALGPPEARLSAAQCRARFGQVDVRAVDMISACDPPPGVVCHRLFVGGYQLDLVMAPNNQRVASAKLDPLIIVADRMID
jgi:hypothetical protein